MLMTIDEIAELMKITTRSVRQRWYDGVIPKPIRIGRRSIRWRRAEVEAFIAAKTGASRPAQKELSK